MLRIRREAAPETLQDFDLAADEKYWEGFDLLRAGARGGGIYLLGYTAEMILKYASFRTQGHRPGTAVLGLFGPAKKWMGNRRPTIPHEGYHNLLFWMHYLRERRRHLGRPLRADADWELVRRVRELYQIWWVEMRYRPDQAQPDEAAKLLDDVNWLRQNRVQLWS
ncbi:MAG: hypothetical protein HY718_04640 [Planctomycetes bacterium]|nr:hypothetical protein [Planctomycetota bacterium]